MSGKVCITGASGGIGEGMARAFAEAGWQVLLAARRLDRLEEIAGELTGAGWRASAHPLDLCSDESCETLSRRVEKDWGSLDVLIHNAGYLGPRESITGYPTAELERAILVNIAGTFRLTKVLLPLLKRSPLPRVIHVSSYLGRNGLPNCVGYIASKFGVEGLTQALHAEEFENGLISVSLAPGMVGTDMLRDYLGQKDVSEFRTPAQVGAATVRLVEQLKLDDGGRQLEVDPWMEAI